MQRLARLTLAFSVLFAIFITSLPFLSRSFGPYPLMKTQDAIDLFTPLVLLPVYWLLFRLEPAKPPSARESIAFLLVASIWVAGQAMHLTANSIGHFADSYADEAVGQLTHFYDEVLGHYLWHSGIVGLSLLLLYRQSRNPIDGPAFPIPMLAGAGILHGLSFALMVLEGVTVQLGLPAALLVVVLTLFRGSKPLRQQPVWAFFFVAYLTAAIFMLAWRVYWGCFVEPLDALKNLGSSAC